MTAPELPEPERLAELVRLARVSAKPPTSTELTRGLDAARTRISAQSARTRRLRRVLFATVPCASLALVLVLARHRREHASGARSSVSMARISGGQVLEGGYLSEVGAHGIRLDFSEGSRFELTPATRARLRAVTDEGARLVLDRGTASFRITPNPSRRWSVEAGPFVVSVRGTDFTVHWEPTSEKLEVQLRRGRVAVSGPIVGDELVLRPGQDLTVNLPNRETVISEASPQQSAAPSAASAPVPSDVPSKLAPPRAAPSSSARVVEAPGANSARHWREALAKGEWDRILADAERDGIDASLNTVENDELFALADAARYRHRPELARAALLRARARFPSSPRAVEATFLLGRVEEQRAGGKLAALGWYDDYLSLAPSGTYAAEALGRKLVLVRETQGTESARRIASEYLRRFPNGSYAAAARTLQQAP